jgi:hypothetical protein
MPMAFCHGYAVVVKPLCLHGRGGLALGRLPLAYVICVVPFTLSDNMLATALDVWDVFLLSTGAVFSSHDHQARQSGRDKSVPRRADGVVAASSVTVRSRR